MILMLLLKEKWSIISFISRLWMIKNDVTCKCKLHKNIIKLQIGQEMALFSKSNHFKCVVIMKILVWWAVFAGAKVTYIK